MVCHYECSILWLTHHFEVPIIVVFTKYDQFLLNIEMHMSNFPNEYCNSDVSKVMEKLFQEYYLHPLGEGIRFVRLQSRFRVKYQECMLMFFGRNALA